MIALRSIEITTTPTERVLRVCAAFGLRPIPTADNAHQPPKHASDRAEDILRQMGGFFAPRLGLLTGPSGGGKSTTLRAVRQHLGFRAIDAQAVWRELHHRTEAIVDLFDVPLEAALEALSRSGLGEPVLWTRSPAQLSEGERARFALAICMARASRGNGHWLLIDECCSTLDAITARSVARLLRRWVDAYPGVRVLCASSRDDLPSLLKPDRVWECAS